MTIRLHGQNYDEAAAEAKRLQIEMGLSMIHPFDDPDVIAGQGTVGMEILKVNQNTQTRQHGAIVSYFRKHLDYIDVLQFLLFLGNFCCFVRVPSMMILMTM